MGCREHKGYTDLDGCPFCLEIEYKALKAENARLREALKIIAGNKQCIDNLKGDADIAKQALEN